jgi:GNAT superfamily N-acetyltransferase
MRIEDLHRPGKGHILDALCEAFHDYPVMTYTLAGAGPAYDVHLRALINSFCENRLSRNHPIYAIRSGHRVLAAAVVSGPTQTPDSPELKEIHSQLDQLIGPDAVDRLAKYDDVCFAGEPNSPHHYLGMLGVRNDHHGQGLGRSLVEHIKSFVRLDPDSTRICLNTETDANVPIYERLGFTVIHESGIDDVHTRCMFWKSD